MAILFSPLANEEMTSAFRPLPGCAFVMIHSAKAIAPIEREIEKRVNAAFRRSGFRTVKATGAFGTKDYLDKIVQMIRGSGFGVAIFSEFTPAKTLANILFEIGICSVLGKDVVMVKTKEAPVPSDFVRNEWIDFDPADEMAFADSLRRACDAIREHATFYVKLGEIALEAVDTDCELAFERFKQAALLIKNRRTLGKIRIVSKRVATISRASSDANSCFKRLAGEIDRFLKLQP